LTWTLPMHMQIVSCDSEDAACSGGYPFGAFEYVAGAGRYRTRGTGTTACQSPCNTVAP
jgi:hypothetical protein